MIFISVLCGVIAAAAHWHAYKKEERYKQEIRALLYILEHRDETYDAKVIDKQETEQGYLLIKVRFFDKNLTEVVRELKMPLQMNEVKIGDTIRVHQISEN